MLKVDYSRKLTADMPDVQYKHRVRGTKLSPLVAPLTLTVSPRESFHQARQGHSGKAFQIQICQRLKLEASLLPVSDSQGNDA
jgi:hypothetical protein